MLVGMLGMSGCGGGASNVPPSAQATPSAGPTDAPTQAASGIGGALSQPSGATAVQGQAVQITLVDDAFQPNDLTIPIGYKVVWVNSGQHPHTVTADDGSFASDTLVHGATFEHTFTQAGTFVYHCQFHGEIGRRGMFGTITVAAGSTPVAGQG
jgi:plastocyanin